MEIGYKGDVYFAKINDEIVKIFYTEKACKNYIEEYKKRFKSG
jgi:hypothetical protein